jgi:hypothetical protein
MTARTRSLMTFGVVVLAACTDTTSPGGTMGRIRIVNSVFQGDNAAAAVPVAIDVLIDSATSGAGIANLVALGLAPGNATDVGAGNHTGAGAIFTAAGYRNLPAGLHSFLARVNGTTASFFQTGSGPYLPKQYMLPWPYTFVLAGVVPDTGAPASGAVPWAMIADDPFPPPTDSARVQVINAAPMADPSGQGTDITATLINGADTMSATASYRGSSGYINPPAGTWIIIFATAADTLHTDTLTFAKGDVRTLLVQSTAYAATPGPGNTKVTNLLDNQW